MTDDELKALRVAMRLDPSIKLPIGSKVRLSGYNYGIFEVVSHKPKRKLSNGTIEYYIKIKLYSKVKANSKEHWWDVGFLGDIISVPEKFSLEDVIKDKCGGPK